ncbi:MAG: hypothetical protein KC620_07245, partial [Myxococcales bacterium]|nr:hypothetical protein [Myxococcales bacterium]
MRVVGAGATPESEQNPDPMSEHEADAHRDPRDSMSLRMTSSLPELVLPDAAAWRGLSEHLERRAQSQNTPLAAARLHHQRGRVLAEELAEVKGAAAAWQAALDAMPGYLPALLALREHAVATDDRVLAERLTDVDLPALTEQPDADRRDVAEMAGAFLLIWLFRWTDAARAVAAVDMLEAVGDPLGLAARLAHLCLDTEQRANRLQRRLDHLQGRHRAPGLAELGRYLSNDPDHAAEGWRLLAEAAERDPVAAWYRIEQAIQTRETGALARGLESLGRLCPGVGAATLMFVAAELYELVLDEPARAQALYAEVHGGGLRAAVALKQILTDARQFDEDAMAMAATLSEQAGHLGDPRLEAVLFLRGAQLAEKVEDLERARTQAKSALDRWPEDERARHLLERILWRTRQWRALRNRLTEDTRNELGRLLRAALLEHALDEPAGALGALGSAEGEIPELMHLRPRQRLGRHLMASGTRGAQAAEAKVRAWQYEATLLEVGDRRGDLYLCIARFYLAHTRQYEKALTYLFWVLDGDPGHLTAMCLIEHCCRRTRRLRPLVVVLERMLPLLDRPEERAPLRRELAELREQLGGPVDVVIELLRTALDEGPGDPATVSHLERLYTAQERLDELRALFEGQLERAVRVEERAAIALRLGPLLSERFGDIEAARGLYARALDENPSGPLRAQLLSRQAELGEAESGDDSLEVAGQAVDVSLAAAMSEMASPELSGGFDFGD